jgi:hypothetical protein
MSGCERSENSAAALIGYLLALGFKNEMSLPCGINPAQMDFILGNDGVVVSHRDLEGVSPEMYRHLMKVIDEGDEQMLEALDLEFVSLDGNTTLGEGGNVTLSRCNEYMKALSEYELIKSCKAELLVMRTFFWRGIGGGEPKYFLERLGNLSNDAKLSFVLKRLMPNDTISINEWKRRSTFGCLKGARNYLNTEGWFWQYCDSLSNDDKKHLLFWICCVRDLKGLSMKIQASDAPCVNLPVVHTCFFTIEIPSYESYEVFVKKLDIATNRGEGRGRKFDFGAA